MTLVINTTKKKAGSPGVVTPSSNTNLDVFASAIANGWDQKSPLVVNITSDIGSSSTANPAVLVQGTVGTTYDITINIAAGVYVCGLGGLGGTNAAGVHGGIALQTNVAIKVNNLGTIGGGGGGGGGFWTGNGAGGNGAGLPVLATVGNAIAATKTNGGTGGASTYGAGEPGGAPGSNGASGAGANAGGGGGGGLGGAGGAGCNRGSGYTFTDPGNNGQGGAGQTDGDPTAWNHPSYAGGTAGAAVSGNSLITWTNVGTIYGSRTG